MGKTYWVYMLKCRNGTLYTGITTNLKRRFKEHICGRGGFYTKINPPIRIVYKEKVSNLSKALRKERQIKSLPRTKKCEMFSLLDD